MEKMAMVYEWKNINEKIKCQYGKVDVVKWLALEKERIERNPKRKCKFKVWRNRISLWANIVKEE